MLEFLATACAAVFTGGAVFVSIVLLPAMLEAGAPVVSGLFAPMYRRAAPVQAGLAIVGALSGLLAAISGAGWDFLLGAVLLGAIVPFTLLRMRPVDDRLLALAPGSEEAPAVLREWSRLHWVRSGCGLLALLFYLLG